MSIANCTLSLCIWFNSSQDEPLEDSVVSFFWLYFMSLCCIFSSSSITSFTVVFRSLKDWKTISDKSLVLEAGLSRMKYLCWLREVRGLKIKSRKSEGLSLCSEWEVFSWIRSFCGTCRKPLLRLSLTRLSSRDEINATHFLVILTYLSMILAKSTNTYYLSLSITSGFAE